MAAGVAGRRVGSRKPPRKFPPKRVKMPSCNWPPTAAAADAPREAKQNSRHNLSKHEGMRAAPRVLILQVGLPSFRKLGRLRLRALPNCTRVSARFEISQHFPVTNQVPALLEIQLARK